MTRSSPVTTANKEIILITATDYGIQNTEYDAAMAVLGGDQAPLPHLSQQAIAFILDIELWASSSGVDVPKLVRQIYGETNECSNRH